MRITTAQIREMKRKGEKITMLTAYDYSMARLFDQAGVPMLLVGDSLGMVMLGYDTTVPVTLDAMVHHTAAVVRGTQRALIVADMPFMTYHLSMPDALRAAARLIQEGGAQAVKLEGGAPVAEVVRRLVDAGVPVMGHLGLTPQAVHRLGGWKVQGRTVTTAQRLLEDARLLEQAGVFGIVLESIPAPLAREITATLEVPTIGIGAGPDCDGQVQVMHDLLGLYENLAPRHAKRYANLAPLVVEAVQSYIAEVQSGAFPTAKNSFGMDTAVLATALERAQGAPSNNTTADSDADAPPVEEVHS